jgi:hypothetical protein
MFHWRGLSPDSDFRFCSLSYVSLTWSIPWQWCSVLFLMLHWRGISRDTDFLCCSPLFHWRDLSRDTDFLYCSLVHWRDLSRDSDFLYCSLCFTDVVYPVIVILCTVPSVSLMWSIQGWWFSVLFPLFHWRDLSRDTGWFSVLFPLFHWRGISRNSDFLYCSLVHWRDLSRDSDFLYCSLCFTDVVYPVIVIFCTVPSVSLTWSIPW